MRRSMMTALLSTATVVPFLAACGTDEAEGPTSTRTATGTTTSQGPTSDAPATESPTTELPTPEPTDGDPAFPESTAAQTAKNSGEWDLVLTDVRVASHEGFDRIVLEFTGTGTPGWTVDYVDEAVLDGSGRKVSLGGDAILDIYASGTTYPASEGDYYSGPRRFQPENGGAIAEMYVVGTFEGSTQVLAGKDGDPVPFRVFALADPARLVVDVADD